MKPRRAICCVVLLLAPLWCGLACSVTDQPLQYRSVPGGWVPVSDSPGQPLVVTTMRPEQVAAPAVLTDSALFARWRTPLAPAGGLWLVLDQSASGGPYDRMWIDTDGDEDLADEQPVSAARALADSGGAESDFLGVEAKLPSRGRRAGYHLNFRFRQPVGHEPHLAAYAACWYEGTVELAGKTWQCILFDYNATGTYDDTRPQRAAGDWLLLTGDDNVIFGRAGRYLKLDQTFYALHIAEDGGALRFTRAGDVTVGAVRVPEGVTAIRVEGANGSFPAVATDGRVVLPVGRYLLTEWQARRKGDDGREWTVTAGEPTTPIVVEAPPAGESAPDFGEPLVLNAAVGTDGDRYVFRDPVVHGRHGERITLSYGGAPPLPELRIRNADGTYDHRFPFEYG